MSTPIDDAVNVKIAQFLSDINLIVDTFGPGCAAQPDLVYDADGKPWPIPPSKMTVGDILHFVHATYGELYVGFCRRFEQLKVH